jgi:MFS family permease
MRWYHGWNVLAAAVLFQALIVGICFTCFTFWVEPWVREFGVGRGTVMWAAAASTIGTGLMMPLAGMAMERVSMRMLICGGALVLALGMVLIASATAIWQIIALYATLVAFGYAFAATLAGQALAVAWFPTRIGLAVGIVSQGSSVGGVVMPPLCTWLLLQYGWRDANLMLAGLVVALVVPLVWLLVRLPRDGELEAPRKPARAAPPAPPAPGLSTAALLRGRAFWVLGLASFGASIAYYAFLPNMASYAGELGFLPQQAAALVSAYSAANIAGRFLFGMTADRIDPRLPFWAASACLVLPLLVTLGQPGYGAALAVSALVGLGAGGLMPVVCVMVGQQFGQANFGRVMGWVIPFFSAAAALGPLVSAYIRDASGDYRAAFAVYLLTVVPAGLALLLLRARRPAAVPQPAQ